MVPRQRLLSGTGGALRLGFMVSLCHRRVIGLLLLLMPCFSSEPVKAASPEPPFTVIGGLSPDGKVAVVVFGNIDWNSAEVDNATEQESHAYLYDMIAKKIIGPLEEIDVDGGSWGHTQENVRADWSPDGRFLAVTYRAGRMLHGYVVYEIKASSAASKSRWRAVPQALPDATSGPNGAAVFAHTEQGPNGGDTVEKWLSPTVLGIVRYGLRPKNIDAEPSPMINDQGEIRIIYAYVDGKWTIKKYEKLPDNY